MKSFHRVSLAALSILLLASTGCKMTAGTDAPGSGGGNVTGDGGGDNGGGGGRDGSKIAGDAPVAGMRATSEILTVLASATGVDPYTGAQGDDIYNYYLNSRMLLPLRGNYDEGQGMSNMTMLSLCAFFARDMVRNENLDANGGRFGAELKMRPNALTPTLRNKLIQKTFNLIVGRDATMDELNAARAEFDLIAPTSSADQGLTQKATRLVVGALLQSPAVQVQ